jgi:class 3 adenylate cyclase
VLIIAVAPKTQTITVYGPPVQVAAEVEMLWDDGSIMAWDDGSTMAWDS